MVVIILILFLVWNVIIVGFVFNAVKFGPVPSPVCVVLHGVVTRPV